MEKHNQKKTVPLLLNKKTGPQTALDAMQRCQAVLAVWTERQKPVEICRELGVAPALLNYWQQRALEGMLQGLEPRVKLAAGTALSPRLQTLLERKHLAVQRRQSRSVKLEQRLHRIQSPPPVEPLATPEKP
jgi:transposase-like protein